MSDFSLCVWCFINIKGIIHPRIKIGKCFIFIPSFTHSKVVSNLSFLLLLNINSIFKTVENQTVAGPQCSLLSKSAKVNEDQQLFGYPHSSKYLLTGGARTAPERMCAVARYYDISSKADRGDILLSTISFISHRPDRKGTLASDLKRAGARATPPPFQGE